MGGPPVSTHRASGGWGRGLGQDPGSHTSGGAGGWGLLLQEERIQRAVDRAWGPGSTGEAGLRPGQRDPLPATAQPGSAPPRHVGATCSGIGRTRSSEPSRVWGWGPRCPNSQEWCLGVDETHMWAQRLAQHMVPELRSSCHQGPEEAGWAGGRRSLLPVILTQRPRVPVCALAKLPFQGSETEGCVRITRGRRGGRPTDWGLPPRRPPALPADQAWPCPASQ